MPAPADLMNVVAERAQIERAVVESHAYARERLAHRRAGPGAAVLASAFTGNRGSTPQGLDITADRSGVGPLTVGNGVHHRPGANLARADMPPTLLAPRMPGPALDGEPGYGSIDGIDRPDSLPVRWEA